LQTARKGGSGLTATVRVRMPGAFFDLLPGVARPDEIPPLHAATEPFPLLAPAQGPLLPGGRAQGTVRAAAFRLGRWRPGGGGLRSVQGRRRAAGESGLGLGASPSGADSRGNGGTGALKMPQKFG